MAPEVEADATVAQLMLAGSAVRHLAHHLLGLKVTINIDALSGIPGPGLRVLIHGEESGAAITRVADSLGLPSPRSVRTVSGDLHYESTGTWRGYDVRVASVVYTWGANS